MDYPRMMGSKGNPCYESTPVFAILLEIEKTIYEEHPWIRKF
jgi:hypothetical protein